MNLEKEAKQIIRTLEVNRFYAQCPCCEEAVLLKDVGLFYLDDFSPHAETLYQQWLQDLKDREASLRDRRKKISQTSEVGAQSVNIGLTLERIAPSMEEFRFDRNDCRSLFDPIDYVIFEGLSRKSSVSKILLVDIKTGHSRLTPKQREIRSLVERRRISWDTYRPPDKHEI